MDTLSIFKFLSGHPVTAPHFKGVFPCDLLPINSSKKLPVGSIFIANTDASQLPGQHWILLSVQNGEHGIYFDTSGQSFKRNEYFTSFLKSHCKTVERNIHQLQSNDSLTCGPFVILLALHLSAGCDFKVFLEKFSKVNLKQNDISVVKLYKKHFKNFYNYKNTSKHCLTKLCIQTCKRLNQ